MTVKQRAASLHPTRSTRLVVLASLVFATPGMLAQSSSNQRAPAAFTLPAYDVVSVKIDKSNSGNMISHSRSEMYSATNISLATLLSSAYGIKEYLIFGNSGPVASARFDIEAKIVDPDVPALKKLSPEERQAMLRTVLFDRFQLQAHTETKVLPVYEMVLAKGGPKFQQTSATDPSGTGEGTSINNGVLTAHAIPMSSLTTSLSYQLQRTIIDKTGLTGRFDLKMSWRPEYGPDASPEDSAASLFTALREQLGLKLQSAKGPVKTLVIDRVEMPSEN